MSSNSNSIRSPFDINSEGISEFNSFSETASFSMGCFWRPDALFGSIRGVIRTRVGYAGGTTENPTYRDLADHIETVQLNYQPARLSFAELLDIFFSHHKPTGSPWKRQYISAIFYHNQAQKELAIEAKQRASAQFKQDINTAIQPYKDFYAAEDRHQKYKLQRQAFLLAEIGKHYPNFSALVSSTLAARLNGYLYGYGRKEDLEALLQISDLSSGTKEAILKMDIETKVIHCSG